MGKFAGYVSGAELNSNLLLIGVNNTNLQIGKQEVFNKKTSQRITRSLGGQCLASVLERQDYITNRQPKMQASLFYGRDS